MRTMVCGYAVGIANAGFVLALRGTDPYTSIAFSVVALVICGFIGFRFLVNRPR